MELMHKKIFARDAQETELGGRVLENQTSEGNAVVFEEGVRDAEGVQGTLKEGRTNAHRSEASKNPRNSSEERKV